MFFIWFRYITDSRLYNIIKYMYSVLRRWTYTILETLQFCAICGVILSKLQVQKFVFHEINFPKYYAFIIISADQTVEIQQCISIKTYYLLVVVV